MKYALPLFSLLLFIAPRLWADDVLQAVTVVKAGNGRGSGFVVHEGDRYYLYTNTHVLEGGSPVSVTTMAGMDLTLGGLEVSNERDVARLALPGYAGHALKLTSGIPSLDDPIQVIGNSDGAGVATKLVGKVLGVGPGLIEIDAKFVQGNSGSPILNDAGEVLGLATFAVKHAEPENWLKKDSRFKEIRRYGVRMEGVEWVEMDMEGFQKRAALLADLNEMFVHIYHMKYTKVYDNTARTEVVYNASTEAGKFREYRWFARDLGSYAVQLNGAWEWIQSFRRGVDDHNSTRSLSERRDAARDIKMSQMMYQQRIVGFKQESKQLRDKVRRLVAHDHWGTDYFLEKAKSQYRMLKHILHVPE